VRTVQDVEQRIGLPFLDALPRLTKDQLTIRGEMKKPWDFVVEKPISRFAETLRNVRSTIQHGWTEESGIALLVTSAMPSEGKSTTAVSLARVMSLSGDRVIIIDCDLRRNSLGELAQRDRGLVELLANDATLEQVIVADATRGLDILPLSSAQFTPEDLFGRPAMIELVARLRQQYDWVVLDGPPVLAVVDATVLAKLVDRVVIVTRWGKTSKYAVETAIGRLGADAAKIVGVLLSMLPSGGKPIGDYSLGAYGKAYDRYYRE